MQDEIMSKVTTTQASNIIFWTVYSFWVADKLWEKRAKLKRTPQIKEKKTQLSTQNSNPTATIFTVLRKMVCLFALVFIFAFGSFPLTASLAAGIAFCIVGLLSD